MAVGLGELETSVCSFCGRMSVGAGARICEPASSEVESGWNDPLIFGGDAGLSITGGATLEAAVEGLGGEEARERVGF